MTCDLLTLRGETFRQTFMTTDFSSAQKWKAVLNKRTIALSFSGSDGDLEALKTFLSDLPWEKKTGVKALGLYRRGHRWIYVGRNAAFAAEGKAVDDVVQLEKFASIDTDILSHDVIRADQLQRIGQTLLSYNEPAKTVTVLGWCCGCYVKEMLRSKGIKYPHLFLIGEAGSGKSTTLERIILPIFGRSKVVAATQTTAFTLMKDAASSNLFPQALDEFKPSKIDRIRLGALYNHFRDSYDSHEGVRGRADQSQVSYALLAPMVIAGEESPDEPAIRERSMELLFSKKDLKDAGARAAFGHIDGIRDTLTSLGRGLLETALTLDEESLAKWYAEAETMFSSSLPSRTVNNLVCCMVGLRLLERLCQRLGLSWQQVFTMDLAVCAKHIEYGVHEYLFDGGDSNKSVVEQTLEIMARMGLNDEECRELEDGKIAIHFHGTILTVGTVCPSEPYLCLSKTPASNTAQGQPRIGCHRRPATDRPRGRKSSPRFARNAPFRALAHPRASRCAAPCWPWLSLSASVWRHRFHESTATLPYRRQSHQGYSPDGSRSW
jgi:ABC-type dipeptide/oligopeptide/nickel transport system ATPase component